MADIIYFDYWTRGVRHFSKIDKKLKSYNKSTLLVHVGSKRGEFWNGDVIIDGVVCRDLKYYGNDLISMLRSERPQLVILLNNQTEDKILVRSCRALGVRVFFIMHGILALGSSVEDNVKMVDSAFGIMERVSRMPKYVSLFFTYLNAINIDKNKRIRDYIEMLRYFFIQSVSPGSNLYGKYLYKDSVADRALVYSERDRDNFIRRFNYPQEKIEVVGNYNLDELYTRVNPSNTYRPKYFLYVESGNSNPKYTVKGWKEELVLKEIESLSSILEVFGYKLYVKLHPSSNYEILFDYKANINVEVFTDNLENLIQNAEGVIGQTSSVMIMAHMINKPICILDIQPLRLLLFEYVEEGIGRLVSSYAEFEIWVKESIQSDLKVERSEALIYEYGPFDGKCSDRILKAISTIIQS